MPRKGRRSKKGKRASRESLNKARVVRVSGTSFFNMSYSSSYSFNSMSLYVNSFPRLNSIRTDFELMRYTKFKFTVMPSGSGAIASIGFLGGNTAGTFAGWDYTKVAELQKSAVWWSGQTRPISITCNHRDIDNQSLWYLTTGSAQGSTSGVVYQGTFLVGGPSSTAMNFLVRVDYECEFSQPVPTTLETVGGEIRVEPSPQYQVSSSTSEAWEPESDEKEPFK